VDLVVPVNNNNMGNKIAVPYLGGKYYILKSLLPNLPQSKVFVDVFGGGGNVVYNKRPKSEITVYNDKAKQVYTFFKVLRNDYDSLIDLLKYTPYSLEMYKEARTKLYNIDLLTDLEIAWYWFIAIRQSFANKSDSFGRAKGRNMPNTFRKSIDNLKDLAQFFLDVYVENLDYKDLMLKYDSKDTLFYLDPPYLTTDNKIANNSYYEVLRYKDHLELLDFVCNINGKVCISHYKTDLYDDKLSGWRNIYFRRNVCVKFVTGKNTQPMVTEAIYMNY